MYWGQSHWTKYILHIFNLLCAVHPSYWDVLSDINYLLIWRAPINAIGWSTYCMSLTMTEWGIPVTGMHSGLHTTTKYILHIYNWLCVVHPSYWDVLSDINYFLIWWASHQCHWMKHMLHVFNHDWMVNPSNWDALGTINYALRSMSLDEPHNWHL